MEDFVICTSLDAHCSIIPKHNVLQHHVLTQYLPLSNVLSSVVRNINHIQYLQSFALPGCSVLSLLSSMSPPDLDDLIVLFPLDVLEGRGFLVGKEFFSSTGRALFKFLHGD
jgi:hypothetical protein